MLAPLALLGVIPLAGLNGILPALVVISQLAAVACVLASATGLVFAIAGRNEEPREFARYSLIGLSVWSGLLVIWLIGSGIAALNRAMF